MNEAPCRLPSGWPIVLLGGLLLAFGPGRDTFGQAAPPPGRLGLGAQIGDPTGLVGRWYFREDAAVDLLAAWGFDRSLVGTIHATYAYAIPDSPLGFFLGPGALVGRTARSDIRLGISALMGLQYFTGRFEVFLQARPGMELRPASRVRIGGAAGLRYYL